MNAVRGSISETSAAVKDSIPSTLIPSANLFAISEILGNSAARYRARSLTSAVKRSSFAGKIRTSPVTG